MKRGFTILELLVVMAIIGMLASIIFVAMSTLQAKSRDSRRIADMREFKKALSIYYVGTNRFPAAGGPVTLTGSDVITTALIDAGAISGFAGDPVSPTFDYVYTPSGVASYTITFCMETDSVPNRTQDCLNTVSP